MSKVRYGYIKNIGKTDFDTAIERVTAALKEEGFGVLTEIDVKNTLKQKLDVDFRRYKILGACNPNLAHRALQSEEHIGLLLPCNVVVQESKAGEVIVSIADPKAMFTMVDRPDVEPVAKEADERLQRVMEKVS